MAELDRYHRQILLPGIGEAGQRRLLEAHALIVGCGALGSMIVDTLTRAGVGTLTIVDRDVVELTNLQRQVLFDETDIERAMPKAEAAKAKTSRINSQVTVHAHVDDFNYRNADRFAEGADIILDGLDNFESRYLINDVAVARGVPYIYGGAVSTTGMSMPILPHPQRRREPSQSAVIWSAEDATPCLRCVFPEAPPPGATATCDTAGVLGPVVSMIAAHQACQALKLLTGHLEAIDRTLLSIDAWTNEIRRVDVARARAAADCPCCAGGEFSFLAGEGGSAATSLCGRNAVQITPPEAHIVDFDHLAARLAPHGNFTHNRFLLRGSFNAERSQDGEPLELTLFTNGRAIVRGTTEPQVARSIYAKYVGG
ncbi:MAG: ThiF family adenylyltransferase [Planctomycetota bacterium]